MTTPKKPRRTSTNSNGSSISNTTKVTLGAACVVSAALATWVRNDAVWKTNTQRDIQELQSAVTALVRDAGLSPATTRSRP